MYWTIRKIVGVHEDADDVLQNTWVKVYRNITTFKGESGLYTWMYRVATNEALSLIRKRKRALDRKQNMLEDLSNRLRADPFFDGNEANILFERSIHELPEKQKQVFIMRYYDELSYAEISEITGISTGGLKAQFHHAKNKIEASLKRTY